VLLHIGSLIKTHWAWVPIKLFGQLLPAPYNSNLHPINFKNTRNVLKYFISNPKGCILEIGYGKHIPKCKFYTLDNVFRNLFPKNIFPKCKIYFPENISRKTYSGKHILECKIYILKDVLQK